MFPMNFYLIGILALQYCETPLSPQDAKGGGGACMMFPDLTAEDWSGLLKIPYWLVLI